MHRVKSQLIVVEGNMTEEGTGIRSSALLQSLSCSKISLNARPHVTRVCRDYLSYNNIVLLDWPPYSPDLSPIEHLWDDLDKRVRKGKNSPTTRAELRNDLVDEGNNIPMRTVNALVNCVQRRIRGAAAARGEAHDILITAVDFHFQ